jgi:hypothetical protein
MLFVAGSFVADRPGARLPHETLITDDHSGDTYVRQDGGPSALTDLCGSSRQSQQEPAVAVDPHLPSVIVAGANDRCGARFGSEWVGFYRSDDGGRSWSRSLVPGYHQDASSAGTRSPAHGSCDASSDPTMAFDRSGTLYYAFLCFGPDSLGKPSVFVARYVGDGSAYERTAVVAGTDPTGFQDKPVVAVDATGGPHDGSIYTAWTDFATFRGRLEACEAVQFARSTNHGSSFGRAVTVSGRVCGELADIAVGPGGSVFVAFRDRRGSIWLATSNDGGAHFAAPLTVQHVEPFNGFHFADGKRICGDERALHCPGDLVYPRSETAPAVAVDVAGVHVCWAALDGKGRGRAYVKSSPDGIRWDSRPVEVRPEPEGHQWMPDIAADGTHLDVVFLDSRDDPAFAPDLPPGERANGTNSGDVVQTYLERSVDGGRRWTEQRLSTHGSNPNWEVEDFARLPFYGDYLSLSLEGGTGFAAWPDSRDVVPGHDSREEGSGEGRDGFDVFLPCAWSPDDIDADTYRVVNDECLTQGGLDLNVYGASFDP